MMVASVLAFPSPVERRARAVDASEAVQRRAECPGCSREVDVRRGVIVGHGWRGGPVNGSWEVCPASWLSIWSPVLVTLRAPEPAALVFDGDDFS